mmetsp:Transcript_11330/g.34687  ORF Transcript_11330/g.34687 Transcript_11330/m.34687 type:complete len:169 (-) Transcript_11330:89-595(-)
MILTSLQRAVPWLPLAVVFTDFLAVKRVEGRSMQPVLNGDVSGIRDFIALEACSIRWSAPSRGEIVALRHPHIPKKIIVKRLVALENDVIKLRDSSRIERVPSGHCWVEGDNGRHSTDSNNFGPVPVALVEFRVVGIVWPPQRFGKLSRSDHFSEASLKQRILNYWDR